jgi:hypothetical protein
VGKAARSLGARVGWLTLVAVLALPAPAAAQMASGLRVDKTPTYTVMLGIGPAENMIMPGDATMAKSGEVMVTAVPMTPPSSMSMMMTTNMDQGMMANHHLEVHISRNATDAVVNDVTPTIRVTDKATGASRDLPQVMGMYGVGMGPTDLHYGQNVWLPDGTYLVTVMVGADKAVFRDVTIMGGAPMSMSGG